MSDLLYKDLCYELTGLAFKVDNALGFGFEEKIYANAFEELLKEAKINYKREVFFPVKMNGKTIAKRYFDFLIDNKIVVELKVGDNAYKAVCGQLFQYLKTSKLKLGLVLRFTRDGIKIKRIPNIY